jgi:lipoate-protein ligase A
MNRNGYPENIWRLLDIEYQDPCRNVATDEALLEAVEHDISPNTLRFWKNKNAVVIGRSQNLKAEVNMDACRKYKTAILRRFTGGGAVYQDYGNLNWTIVMRKSHLITQAKSIPELFEVFAEPILHGINNLGVQAKFKPTNSIFINGKKISGMAAYVKKNSVLCHGTLLVNTNLDILTSVLRRIKVEVTTLQHSLGEQISMADVEKAIKNSFTDLYSAKVEKGALLAEELKLIKELNEKKYSTSEWNLKVKSKIELKLKP